MPGMKGLEVLKALKQMEPTPKVVILTVSDAHEDIVAALRGGADGYLLKDTDPENLLDRLHELTQGHLVVSTISPSAWRSLFVTKTSARTMGD